MGSKSSSSNTVSQTRYGNTTTSNPYAQASTNDSGTTASFQQGNALDSIYNYVNKNINSLLDEYLSPNLNSVTNQAKLNSYISNLNKNASLNLENNIIRQLSKRNMVRSSQATDLYKNLSDKTTDSLRAYINELLAASQDNTAKVLNNLLKAYMQGYSVLSDMQKQSLNTSQGNATKESTTNTVTNNNNFMDYDQMAQAITAASPYMFI